METFEICSHVVELTGLLILQNLCVIDDGRVLAGQN